MYNYSYEEYMNNLLGNNTNIRGNMMYQNMEMMEPFEDENAFTYNGENKELEECYPDIYKIIYPMVCKACLYINEEITEDLVDRIANEIYENLEQDEMAQETRGAQAKINYSNVKNNKNIRYAQRNILVEDTKDEKRQRNFLLNDLIRILVLRELLGIGRRPHKPILPVRPLKTQMPRPHMIDGGNMMVSRIGERPPMF